MYVLYYILSTYFGGPSNPQTKPMSKSLTGGRRRMLKQDPDGRFSKLHGMSSVAT